MNRERELCKKQNDPYFRPKNSNATLYALGSQTSECTSLISVLAKIPARQGLLGTAKPIGTRLLNCDVNASVCTKSILGQRQNGKSARQTDGGAFYLLHRGERARGNPRPI